MESLYARDTPTAQGLKLRAAQRDHDQVALKLESSEQPKQQSDRQTETSGAVETATEPTANPTDDAFGFNFAGLPREELDEQWRSELSPPETAADSEEDKAKQEPQGDEKGEGAPSQETAISSSTEEIETKTAETSQQEATPAPAPAATPTLQARRAGVASAPRKSNKPAITINTGSGSSSVGAKRPPPTPVSPPVFSWNDILRVQNLIERCLQQYSSKNEILLGLKEEANIDPAFTSVVWQKLEEQNPTFFRAYSLQLQLKEQIKAFNYLVAQQKEMAAKGGKRFLHYSSMDRQPAGRAAPCPLDTTATTTTLPPISMDARTFLRTPIKSSKQQHMHMYQLASPSVGLGATSSGMTTMPPPSPLPLPSPIKTDLDTHAFFT